MDLASGGGPGLLERDLELEALSALVESACAGDGRTVLIEGAPGIGKSSLLEACVERASAGGMTVWRARGDEMVRESSFAAVRELLWPHVSTNGTRGLGGAARLAAPVFEGDTDEIAGADRVGVVLHGLYWLVADAADRGPLLLGIDDAQWLDPASSRFLIYLARRVESLPILLAIAVRREPPDMALGELSTLATCVLRPEPLSANAAQAVVRRELGPRADDELCRSCHEATGGNPFYLRELLTALKAEPGRPTVEVARRVRSLGAGTIGRSVLVRLARLGGDCERLAEAVTVLGPGSPLRRAATLAELGRDRAEHAADRLRSADLLTATPSLSFAHPIVNEAVAAEMAPSRRSALHAKAALLLADERAPADRVATHLLFAEPFGERWVVEALRAAGRHALSQGAPEAAASYLRRAMAEPPPAELRLEVLVELGRAEALLPIANNFAAFREALELVRDPIRRIEIVNELAWNLVNVAANISARVLLEDVLDRADDLEPALVERLEAHLLGGGAPDLTATRRILVRTARHTIRARRGEVHDPAMLSALAQTGAITGLSAAEAAGYARAALRNSSLMEIAPAYLGATGALTWADELEDAARAQDRGIEEGQRRGSAPIFMQMSSFRAATAFRAGELNDAEDHARRAYELGRELGADHFAAMFFVPILLELGYLDEASQLVESIELSERELQLWQGAIVLAERGHTRVAVGELEAGLTDLLDANRRMSAAGCHLGVLTDWASPAAAALAQLGRHEEARELAHRELAEAVDFGAPRRHGIALATLGRLESGPKGLVGLREAVRVLEPSPARLEYARALVNLGSGLRERGQPTAARPPLAQGLDLAHACGAAGLAESARRELVGTGARPRRAALSGPEALTPAELRAARMAAEGLTNREIAQALFVSAKTVETHLSHAYGKLGISTRAALARALTAEASADRAPGAPLMAGEA